MQEQLHSRYYLAILDEESHGVLLRERNKTRGCRSELKRIGVISQKRDIFILRKQRKNTCAV